VGEDHSPGDGAITMVLTSRLRLAGMTDDQPKRGRPSDYSFQIAMSICDRLVDGENLRRICSDAGMPSRATVFRWIACHKEFREEYILVRELRAEDLGEEMIEIADDPCVWVKKIGADGRAVMVLDHDRLERDLSETQV
jgi:hypothetical protein